MKNVNKYTRQYFMPPVSSLKWTQKEYVEKAPIWCSVDLRDGNQSLIVPMSLEEKLEFFQYLCKIGFKEIEVGFPAASETEYEFLRTLIEQDLIPDDVTVQVLTQSREHIIRKTFESLKGAKNAIVHLYNSTSVAQREQVFKKSKQEIIDIAVFGAKLFNQIAEETGCHYQYEYSPESFTGTEMDFAVEICNAVLDVWKPTPDNKVIINLPVTVSHSMPHVYASQVEYMCDHLNNRENVIVSLHPHNDRGCAVADSELGLLAGADRIEGTLFGNGERTGNLDIVVVGLNMFTQGVDPRLDFSNLPAYRELYERCTKMHIPERQPYVGELVFTAFSGSHQDAINKGTIYMREHNSDYWEIPYLPIDPADVGRQYEPIIRINSQSGKGGAAFVMQNAFGYNLPKAMHPEFGALVKAECDRLGREVSADELFGVFRQHYIDVPRKVDLRAHSFVEDADSVRFTGVLVSDGKETALSGSGNGPIDAFFNALQAAHMTRYEFLSYHEHAISSGSDSKAIAYIQLKKPDGKPIFGVGIENNINLASVRGVLCAINRAEAGE